VIATVRDCEVLPVMTFVGNAPVSVRAQSDAAPAVSHARPQKKYVPAAPTFGMV
jgi:hypothetical protein